MEGYEAWRTGRGDLYNSLAQQLRGLHGEIDDSSLESIMRQIYEHGNSRKALRDIQEKNGIKDISGKGMTDAQLAREVRKNKNVDRKGNQKVDPKAGQQPAQAAQPAQPAAQPPASEWDEKKRIGNSNAAIAAVTDQQIENGAWFEHSKAGKTKITKEMRDWAKKVVEQAKNPMKPDTAPKQQSVPTPAQNNAAASVPKTLEQQGAAAAMEQARKGNAQRANQAANIRNMPEHMQANYVNLGPMANTVRQGMR